MPHQALKLLPGIDQNKTPALNEAAISESQLVRFIPDRTLGGLVQKLGGWTKYVSSTMGSIVRCLWAWEDVNANSYLAVGCEGIAAGGGKTLQVVSNAGISDITPTTTTAPSVTINASTVINTNAVRIIDTGRNISSYDSVYIKTQISVGGLILFGQYQCYNDGGSANEYTIYAINTDNTPALATSTVSNGGSGVSFTTASGKSTVEVTLINHGFQPGDIFTVLLATTVGGITISAGNYTVASLSLTTPNDVFVINAKNLASSTATASLNGGKAYYLYYKGSGALPIGTGYGIGGYGIGGYGTGVAPVIVPGTPINAVDWTLDNWGQTLIACNLDGPIYQWTPSTNQPLAVVIPEAPPVNEGAFVAMPQRQIVAWGTTFDGIRDPLLIRWCDIGNYNDWNATLTNQAGSYRIPKGSRIVQCIQGPQQGLIWTDLGLWAMQYVGPPYAYNFNEVGNGCGLIGRKAATSVNGNVYWMGPSQFFKLSGGGVEPIRCPVWDVVFQDLDTTNLDRIRVAANSRFGEITWYFPTYANSGENEGYVKYNFILDQWDYGFNSTANPYVARSAWINESVLGPPIGAGLNQYIYQHETSSNADGAAMNSYFQTGYFVLSEADIKMFIDQVWPDMKWGYFGGSQSANILLTFYVADYAGQEPLVYGPYTLTQATTYITPRFRGRLVSIRIESNDINSWWRLGNFRYRLQPDGKF
jgi:hypothetical protein